MKRDAAAVSVSIVLQELARAGFYTHPSSGARKHAELIRKIVIRVQDVCAECGYEDPAGCRCWDDS